MKANLRSVVLWLIVIFAIVQTYKYRMLRYEVASAYDQINFFNESELLIHKQQTPQDFQDLIDAVVRYYPSGTKQKIGTPLDKIVEHERRRVEDIIREAMKIGGLQETQKSHKKQAEKVSNQGGVFVEDGVPELIRPAELCFFSMTERLAQISQQIDPVEQRCSNR